jgi:UDPglucose--hexose-1-phosphate uridylyltransferase
MFTSIHIDHPAGFIEYRTENHTGIRTRICPERLKRGIGSPSVPDYSAEGCPFCSDLLNTVTPVFSDGSRINIGESVTFPNLYPFAAYHVVTVITTAHSVQKFSERQIIDALSGQVRALRDQEGYISINWNYLPSAGASLTHPHLQGLSDRLPDTLSAYYLECSIKCLKEQGRRYSDLLKEYEVKGGRSLNGTRLFWYANPVPIGEREIRCILPLTTIHEFPSIIDDFASDLITILGFYRDLGTSAFNLAIFFGNDEDRDHYSAFCSIISRINPNPLSTSDTAFMERLHLEPVILTLPEELASIWSEYR